MHPHDIKYRLQICYMIAFVKAFHYNVIYVAFHYFAYMLMKNCIHSSMICYPCVLQSEGHDSIAIHPQWRPERCMLFIVGYILIWLYLEIPSIKDIRSNPHVLSIMTSVIGRENSSLGHALFRSWKLMQTLIFPFFLVTGLILATQSGCYSSLIKPKSISFLTSNWIVSIISGRNCHCCCLTGFASGLMLRRCIATWGSSLGMSS